MPNPNFWNDLGNAWQWAEQNIANPTRDTSMGWANTLGNWTGGFGTYMTPPGYLPQPKVAQPIFQTQYNPITGGYEYAPVPSNPLPVLAPIGTPMGYSSGGMNLGAGYQQGGSPNLPSPVLPTIPGGVTGAGAASPFAGMQNPRANQGGAPIPQAGAGLGTGGATKPNTTTPKPNTTTPPNNGNGTGVAGQGNNQNSLNAQIDQKRLDYSRRFIDGNLRNGNGFTDQFIALHKVDPITFYMRAFMNDSDAQGFGMQNEQGQRAADYLYQKAATAAVNDARFLPGAVDEWKRQHGDTPIPDSQWQTWWDISQKTNGYGINGNAGVNQYGVY